MANEKNIKNYTAADIEKYHHGLLSSKERHDLEKAALDDPFLADALEGYSFAGINISADINDLKGRFQKRVEGAKIVPIAPASTKGFPWLRAAVAIVLILGTGLLVYQFAFNNPKKKELAITTDSKKSESTVNSGQNDSTQPVVTTPSNTNTGEVKTDKGTTQYIATNPPTGATDRTDEKEHRKFIAPVTLNDDIRKKPGTDTITDFFDKKTTTNAVVLNGKSNNYYSDSQVLKKDSDKESVLLNDDAKFKALAKTETVQPSAQNGEGYNKQRANANRRVLEDQQRSNILRGRVTDADNNGLPFARVINTEDNVGTYADAKGNFNLVSPDSVLNVQVRAIGFNNLNYQLRNGNGNTPSQVVMQEDKSLNEVVISNKKVNTVARTHNANMKLEEPEPADGWDNYDTYIANNLDVPDEFREKPINEAVVELSFEVDKNGQPVNIRVEKSLCAKCDEEAKRLIKQGPKWIRNAKKGRTTVKIPFSGMMQ